MTTAAQQNNTEKNQQKQHRRHETDREGDEHHTENFLYKSRDVDERTASFSISPQ